MCMIASQDFQPKRILTGIKPTARPHIGNFLGMMQHAVALQEEYECYFMIADLHALTIPIAPDTLRKNIEELALDLLAVGFDPKKATLFIQSHVPEHSELAWIFNCVISVGELERMIEYKEMRERFPENANAGLLDYPVLQASDILLYRPYGVPVGKDQQQHLELTNTIVRRFNRRFEVEYFTEPKAMIYKGTEKVMSLRHPDKKMSKSLGEGSYIGLTDSPDLIRKKVAKAVTDSGPAEQGSGMSSGVKNLFSLLRAAGEPEACRQLEENYREGSLSYARLKDSVAEAISEFLRPIRDRRAAWEKDRAGAMAIFAEGSEKARACASATMKDVHSIIGIR